MLLKLEAVVKANLVATLSGGPFTVFAPTNDAFAKIPADVLNKLLANVTALTGTGCSMINNVYSLMFLLAHALLFDWM